MAAKNRRPSLRIEAGLVVAFVLALRAPCAGAGSMRGNDSARPQSGATGFVYGDVFLRHDTGPGHPERPARLRAILDLLEKDWPSGLLRLHPVPAAVEHVVRVHPLEYVKRVEAACRAGATRLDAPDTPISRESYSVALHATGGVLKAVDAVLEGRVRNAFCAVRPPGHHATATRAMGFCLFNHAAVAAAYVLEVHGLERVAIIDWDVHHGNGIQDIFYEDPRVYYISLHQHPLYPGTGKAHETGAGPGEGTTLNLPLAAGAGDDEYLAVFRNRVVPAVHAFDPDFILISAGFDAHRDDPLGGMNLSDEGFAQMTREIVRVAETVCGGRVVSILEGGYNLDALAGSVRAHIQALLDAVESGPRPERLEESRGMKE